MDGAAGRVGGQGRAGGGTMRICDIATLVEQVERLTAERDEARAEAARWHHDLIVLRAELHAERARREGRRAGWRLP